MATTLIKNGATSGAMGAILAGRLQTSSDPATFADEANAAAAFATQFLTANAALAVPMADADNAQIGQLIAHVCFGILEGRNFTSAVATDYTSVAAACAAASKAAVSKLV